jgi:hypothetical protein
LVRVIFCGFSNKYREAPINTSPDPASLTVPFIERRGWEKAVEN